MPEAEVRPPSIGDYALIGDCRTAALVSREGSIDWLCLPNFASPSVFARILDPSGGAFALRPGGPFKVRRRYVPQTAVLETTFETSTGVARLLDALPVGDDVRRLRPLREVLRIVTGVEGRVDFELSLQPRPLYARPGLTPVSHARFGWGCTWGDEVLHLRAEVPLDAEGQGVFARFDVAAGDVRRFALAYGKGEPLVYPELGPAADARMSETTQWWRGWSREVRYEGPYREMVVRSAVTLKLLSYCLSGAIVAAPTTSLPEQIGGGRNWDYRYCWLRDAGLTMYALLELGIDEDARGFLEWLLHATRLTAPKLRIMYDLYGRTGLQEHELGHLAGFRGSRPVRIGNGAYDQRQTDVYGEVLLAAHAYAEAGGRIDRAGGRMLKGLGGVIRAIWREPDSGIWEVRGAPRHYTYSKMMCWVGLDRLLAMDRLGVVELGRARVETEQARSEIGERIEREAYNETLGAYAGEFGGDVLDASLLTMASVGYRAADDRRVVSTFNRIREQLGQGDHGLVRRYDPAWDGLQGGEGAFGICSFWAAEQAARQGDPDEAERRLAGLLTLANDVGLFSEEADVETGEPLGNFPQAFTHVGFINAVLAIGRARGRFPVDQGVPPC